jgi:hypothetical protein
MAESDLSTRLEGLFLQPKRSSLPCSTKGRPRPLLVLRSARLVVVGGSAKPGRG